MPSTRLHLLLFVGVLFVTIESGICLKCYKCNSTEKACGEPFKSKDIDITECPTDIQCQKVKHPTVGGVDEPITRGCYNGTLCTNLSVCLECDSDLCNSSNAVMPAFILSSIAVAVLLNQHLQILVCLK